MVAARGDGWGMRDLSRGIPMDIAGMAIAARQADTQMSLAAIMVKQAHDRQAQFVAMIEEQAKAASELAAAPPPGAGTQVDISV